MAVTRKDYSEEAVEAAHSVLLEVMTVLGEYREGIVLIGGWVPQLLLPESEEMHVGSTDVDLALDHRILQEPGYETIRNLLEERGYVQDERQPFIFWREFESGGRSLTVQVDLLAGEYEGTGRSHRTQRIQDANARKVRGCGLVFSSYQEVRIEGVRPDGSKDSTVLKVCSVVPFIVMKGMAMMSRDKEKDAYDIFFCVSNYPGGLDTLVKEIRPHLSHGLVREGLENIAGKFASPEHVGPAQVADFDEIPEGEDREMVKRDAYEKIHYVLTKLDIGE